MVRVIHKIAIVTNDVEAAVRFYTEKLGLAVVERFSSGDDDAEGGEDYVFLDAGGVILELMPAAAVEEPAGFHHISFLVDDMDGAVQELDEKGVTILKQPFTPGVEELRLAFFEGPDGLNLQLFERK